MASVIRSKLAKVLQACRVRLVYILRWPEERVIICQADELPDVQAEQYIALRLGAAYLSVSSAASDVLVSDGAGRNDARVMRRLAVRIRTRSGLAETGRDEDWLIPHLEAENSVFNALFHFQPVDAQDNWLVVEPLKLALWSMPMKDRRDADWGDSTIEFNLHFTLDLDLGYQ